MVHVRVRDSGGVLFLHGLDPQLAGLTKVPSARLVRSCDLSWLWNATTRISVCSSLALTNVPIPRVEGPTRARQDVQSFAAAVGRARFSRGNGWSLAALVGVLPPGS